MWHLMYLDRRTGNVLDVAIDEPSVFDALYLARSRRYHARKLVGDPDLTSGLCGNPTCPCHERARQRYYLIDTLRIVKMPECAPSCTCVRRWEGTESHMDTSRCATHGPE